MPKYQVRVALFKNKNTSVCALLMLYSWEKKRYEQLVIDQIIITSITYVAYIIAYQHRLTEPTLGLGHSYLMIPTWINIVQLFINDQTWARHRTR